MTGRRLYIVESLYTKLLPAQIDAIELACLDTHYTAIEACDYLTAVESLKNNKQDMLVIDVKTLQNYIESLNYIPNEQTILLIFAKENPEMSACLDKIGNLRFLVAVGIPSTLRSVVATILEHKVSGEIRGMVARLADVNKIQGIEHRINSSEERSHFQEEIAKFFSEGLETYKSEAAIGSNNYPKYLSDVLDELLMNAIWDANKERNRADRTLNVTLAADENIRIKAQFDGTSMILTVCDSQGTFPVSALMKPMIFALGFKDIDINEGHGGAGIGMRMVLQKIPFISFEIDRGKLTRVTTILKSDQSVRETQRRPRTILYFERETRLSNT